MLFHSRSLDSPENVASIILAGGQGTRLFPLTLSHCKPAVSFGGRYRLIDIPISNSVNSHIRKLFVVAQYMTSELQHHLTQAYHFDYFSCGSIDFLTPQEKANKEKAWYEGTADAIRKNIEVFAKAPVDYFLILSGDQLYNIDFRKMVAFAMEKDANLTIASLPVDAKMAKRLGILKTDQNSYITDFVEKPQDPSLLSPFTLSEKFYQKWNIPTKSSPRYLASMGIYIFKKSALLSLLQEDTREDFGKHLIPTELKKGKTAAFLYDGYWEDIGTISSFYEANLSLNNPSLRLNTYDENNPIYTQLCYLPGPKVKRAQIENSILCEGSIIEGKEISNSIIGMRTSIDKGTVIRNSVILGNHHYTPPIHQGGKLPDRLEIGKNCLLEKVIVDEHALLGNNVTLINRDNRKEYSSNEGIFIRDGIIVVSAGTYVPDGYTL